MDALEDLKATNSIVTTSFKNDLLMLQNKHKALTTDHEQQKTQLIDALLTKDRLVKDLASLKEGATRANGDNGYQKAQAKATIEEENSRKVLQEVSKPVRDPHFAMPSKKRKGFLKTLSRFSLFPHTSSTQVAGPMQVPKPTVHSVDTSERCRSTVDHVQGIPHDPTLSFRPYTTRGHDVGFESTPKTDQAILESLELSLQRERSVFGGLPTVTCPLISPRMIPLPPSPTRTRSERTDLRRVGRQKSFGRSLTTFIAGDIPRQHHPGSSTKTQKSCRKQSGRSEGTSSIISFYQQ